MAAFDRVPSGIDGLDLVLDSIRLGDNVVWQVSSLDEFRPIANAFVARSVADGRNVVYLRFASHERLVAQGEPGVTEVDLDPNRGFETFTMQVHDTITREGPEAFYVFDSLSDLQVAWSADLTMGNFFRLTCPYLFSLDTVAYFPIIRGGHSFAAIAKIHDTTQLLIDVSPDEGGLFVHPLKVWRRYSPTMFLAHRLDFATGEVSALTSGVDTSRFYARMSAEMSGAADRDTDSWDRFFAQARAAFEHGEDMRQTCRKMCNMMMTREARMRALVQEYFSPGDYFDVRRRMVGTGMIGGKACGMLLSRKIVERRLPGVLGLLEPHDSFYVGTDVFYTFIVENDLWPLRIQQRGDGYLRVAAELARGIEHGTFPTEIEQGFRRILDYYGQVPIIVRSSSCLEDAFGNAFAGKYDSVFLPNAGSPEERLREFERAVKRVYASTMNPSALEYRRRSGLDTAEEEMALLVQRVSGSRYGTSYFMPTAAGIGYSRSAYRWLPDMDPTAGMLRLVMGLGTKAVDRTERDYPRLVSLDRPEATTMVTDADRHRFCQRGCDLIDLAEGAFAERPCTEVEPLLPVAVRPYVMEHDREAERMLRERGHARDVTFASCAGRRRVHGERGRGRNGDGRVAALRCQPAAVPAAAVVFRHGDGRGARGDGRRRPAARKRQRDGRLRGGGRGLRVRRRCRSLSRVPARAAPGRGARRGRGRPHSARCGRGLGRRPPRRDRDPARTGPHRNHVPGPRRSRHLRGDSGVPRDRGVRGLRPRVLAGAVLRKPHVPGPCGGGHPVLRRPRARIDHVRPQRPGRPSAGAACVVRGRCRRRGVRAPARRARPRPSHVA